ncbi:MAG: hypothetical protein KC766_33365 [Myxococcales bacterium]|nr:hypothetical protein [Myxococcales bacterium]
MAKLSTSDKAQRVLTFLQGLSNPKAILALRGAGFGEPDLDEGWRLLRELRPVDFEPLPERESPRTLEELDAWENHWFPVAKATLAHRSPKIHDELFLNVHQTAGLDVLNSVGVFLERLAALEKRKDPEARDARALLSKRGLDRHVVDQALALLAEVQRIPEAPPEPRDTKEALKAREAALWAWYLEWSAIARVKLTDKTALRALGFLRK